VNRINILLVEDHMIVREGLRRLLESEVDLAVIGEASNGSEALALAIELSPDVVLMDIEMPRGNGLQAMRRILKFLPGTKIIVLTAHADEAHAQKAIHAGAAGFLPKQHSVNALRRVIRKVQQGHNVYIPPISESSARFHLQHNGAAMKKQDTSKLTSREIEVLQCITGGSSNKQTAEVLGISIKTVEKHRGHLMEKLGIHNTASLTRYAITTGIAHA
jgi:DNA-binding NarL/FixJ family response regulator